MAAYVMATGAAVTGLGVMLATWCPGLGRAVGLTVTGYIAVTVGWIAVWALLSRIHPKRQFWHDALAGTCLVSASP